MFRAESFGPCMKRSSKRIAEQKGGLFERGLPGMVAVTIQKVFLTPTMI